MKFRFFVALAAAAAAVQAAAPQPFEGGSEYRVLILSDTHFDAEEFHQSPGANKSRQKERERNLGMWKSRSPKLLEAAAGRAEAVGAAFVVHLGDMAQGDCDTPELQKAMIEKAFADLKKYFPKLPLVVVKGNHDIRTKEKRRDNDTANAALLPLVAKELKFGELKNGNYAFRYGPDLFIAVDGFVSARECVAFVKKTLDDNQHTRYVFLLTHLPLLPASPGSSFWLLPGHYQIASLLETRQTLVLAGHTHRPSFTTRSTKTGRLPQLVVCSLGASFRSKAAPGNIQDWQSFLTEAKKNTIRGDNAAKMRKAWRIMESKGTYTHKQLFANSGFVVLDIGNRKVESRYYINASAKPASTMLLMVKH